MRVLFVTSEVAPLIKTGGLADVSAALPAALHDMGVDIRVLLPGYPQVLKALPNLEVVADFATHTPPGLPAFPPSRLLLPMCYAATLGGVLTLVGTSTNLLINSFLVGRGMPGLHLFDLLPVGLAVLLGCGAMMLLLYPRLLAGTAV